VELLKSRKGTEMRIIVIRLPECLDGFCGLCEFKVTLVKNPAGLLQSNDAPTSQTKTVMKISMPDWNRSNYIVYCFEYLQQC